MASPAPSASSKIALFDIDGTLIDSNDAQADSWVESLRAENLSTSFEEVRRLIGLSADELLVKLTGIDAHSTHGLQLIERRRRLFNEAYLPKLKPFAGARDLLLRLRAEGFRLVSKGDEALIKKAGVADLFDSQKLEPTIVFGDSPFDALSGVPFVAFLSGGWRPEDFPEALAIYEGPLDCLRQFAHSPLADPSRLDVVGGTLFPL